jgi:hemolysin III
VPGPTSTYPPKVDTVVLKPRLRGVLHQYAAVVALVVGIGMVVAAPDARAKTAAAVYGASISLMLGVSALYHRGQWHPRIARRLQRLDHTTIFLAIAGTYTPVALLALNGRIAPVVLITVWTGCMFGGALEWSRARVPRALSTAVYVVVGWVAMIALPSLWSELGVLPFLGILAGGVLYTLGATVYARKRPDPFPRVFGFHELFHALVVAAVAVHGIVIASAVLPRG